MNFLHFIILLVITKVDGFNFIDSIRKIKLFKPNVDLQNEKIIDEQNKICKNCKYYLNTANNQSPKCSYYSKYDNSKYIDYLVTGNNKDLSIITDDYYYCSTARSSESMCGENAINYQKKK